MDVYVSGTCLLCNRSGVAVHQIRGLCSDCLGDSRVRISGEGNNVTVGGSDLAVFAAGGKVHHHGSPMAHPHSWTEPEVRTIPTSADEAVRLAYDILKPLPVSGTDPKANMALWEMQRARMVLLEWICAKKG